MRRKRTWRDTVAEWFEPKQVGFGWQPKSWQGYLLVVLLITVMVAVAVMGGGVHAFRPL